MLQLANAYFMRLKLGGLDAKQAQNATIQIM